MNVKFNPKLTIEVVKGRCKKSKQKNPHYLSHSYTEKTSKTRNEFKSLNSQVIFYN